MVVFFFKKINIGPTELITEQFYCSLLMPAAFTLQMQYHCLDTKEGLVAVEKWRAKRRANSATKSILSKTLRFLVIDTSFSLFFPLSLPAITSPLICGLHTAPPRWYSKPSTVVYSILTISSARRKNSANKLTEKFIIP